MGATLGDYDAVHASASPQLSFSAASANQAILYVETERRNLSGAFRQTAPVVSPVNHGILWADC